MTSVNIDNIAASRYMKLRSLSAFKKVLAARKKVR
jgi:hypothetical protein